MRINEFSKVVGYKINIQKFVAFLYTNKEISERESKKKKILFKSASKKIPRNKLNQGNKHLYAEDYKTLKKKLKMIQRNGRISHALGLEELIFFKWPYYSKQSTDLMQSLSKYP